MSAFASVSTSAARYQEMSLNPQKLAGQCGKLKCCLNYELKCYIDAQVDFPDTSIPLETDRGKAYHIKTDVYRRIMWYSFEKDNENAVFIPLDVDVIKEIIRLNRQGILLNDLEANSGIQIKEPVIIYQNAVGEDSINRFEEKRRKKKKKSGKENRENRGNGENRGNREQKETRKPLEIDEEKPRIDRNNLGRHQYNRNKKN